MKNSLSHLPKPKQTALKTLTKLIQSRVPAEMIILFGSYARGTWVEDYQEKYEYVSDFDILVITKDKASAKQGKVWRDLDKEISVNKEITKVNIIHHSIGFVNDKIERNYYFFIDILKEGILLFDSGIFNLSEPKKMSPAERQEKAQEEFEHWYETGAGFLKTFKFNFQENDLKIAAFQLHQATERFYAAVLLVFTDYKPRTHDIEDLGNQVAKQHPGFGTVFPMTTPEEERLFTLLKRAYIDARYNKHYKIEKEELEYLGERVKLLKELTERICNERIAQFTEDGEDIR